MTRKIGGIGDLAFEVTQLLRQNSQQQAADLLRSHGASPERIPNHLAAIRQSCLNGPIEPRPVNVHSLLPEWNKNSFKLF